MAEPFSSDSYFEHERPPATIQSDKEKVAEFVSRQRQAGRKVVLVTVGLFPPDVLTMLRMLTENSRAEGLLFLWSAICAVFLNSLRS